MVMNLLLKISKLGITWALILFILLESNGQSAPVLQYGGGNVWVTEIDKEVLYTFARYFNRQEDWQSIFPVRVQANENSITVSGRYDVFENSISFTPRYPFAAGTIYEAKFQTAQLSKNFNEVYLPAVVDETLMLEFEIAKEITTSARVKEIYPTTNIIPENLLKFHIAFSSPMQVGEVYRRVKLVDSNNREIEKAFLVVDQEFWDDEMKLVTILLDPGRIKRGLKGNQEMNTPLQANLEYTLVIDQQWKNIEGRMLESNIEKKFHTVAADRTSPTKNSCKLSFPKTLYDPLIIEFNELMNITTLHNSIKVEDSNGKEIAGDIIVLDRETGIQFKPKGAWESDTYVVRINPLTEDLAGNNFNRVFDEDITEDKSKKEDLIWKFQLSQSAN
jgi:hypothetical protein